MRSRVGAPQNHYLKNDVSSMDDEPEEPEPKQLKEIINKVNKIVVERIIIKRSWSAINKNVESIKNKKLTDEEQK